MFPYSPSSRLCNRRRLSNGPDILLCDFYEHSSLRVGAEQEQLAFGDPVSGSGAVEPLSNRRRKHGKADGEAYCSPGLLGQVSGALPVITLCYEVGNDAFWLARFLMGRSIECLVIDPGSLQVNRRARRVKTDRVDVKMLLRTLIAWCRGERHVWSLVRIPSIDEEDLRALAPRARPAGPRADCPYQPDQGTAVWPRH